MKQKFKAIVITGISLAVSIPAYSDQSVIASGIPLFDQNNTPVNAHGACIVEDDGKYYLFGEWKSDSSNAFQGFSCYSSDDLEHWTFESVALPLQDAGLLGPDRVGERVKVMRCPSTGEYVMYMHADNLGYKDQYTAYATSDNITGPYKMHGPLMLGDKPIRHWDMGAFKDTGGTGYILAHHGPIYRLADDYKSAVEMISNVKGSGESPAVFKKNGTYYHLSSNLTSWERNDNFYFTAPSIAGPWTKQGYFCPEGSLTWNSQSSFVLPIVENNDTIMMYMGDRWSYPHQASSATYVWLPLQADGEKLRIPDYMQFWDKSTGKPVDILKGSHRDYRGLKSAKNGIVGEYLFDSETTGEKMQMYFKGRKVAVAGHTSPHGGYAMVRVTDAKGDTVYSGLVDFYSLKPADDIRVITHEMPKGKYMLTVEVAGDHPVWYNKKGTQFGSDANRVMVKDVYIYD